MRLECRIGVHTFPDLIMPFCTCGMYILQKNVNGWVSIYIPKRADGGIRTLKIPG